MSTKDKARTVVEAIVRGSVIDEDSGTDVVKEFFETVDGRTAAMALYEAGFEAGVKAGRKFALNLPQYQKILSPVKDGNRA